MSAYDEIKETGGYYGWPVYEVLKNGVWVANVGRTMCGKRWWGYGPYTPDTMDDDVDRLARGRTRKAAINAVLAETAAATAGTHHGG